MKRRVASQLEAARLENEAAQRHFERKYRQALSVANLPPGAPKHAREIAASKPWTGEESYLDLTRRVLEDSIRPVRVSRSQRLARARENVLDYAYSKVDGPTFKDRLRDHRSNRRAQPGLAAGSGLDGGRSGSIAADEMEDAVSRRQWDAQDVMAATRDALAEAKQNPAIDFTEYLLNNILRKQGATPTWIAKQIAVRDRIEQFRALNCARLQERLVHRIADLCSGDVNNALALAADPQRHRDPEWEQTYAGYLEEALKDINSQIRGYNLQAPTSARRGYLNKDDELLEIYKLVPEGLETALRRFLGCANVAKANKALLHSSAPPQEPHDNYYGFKHLLRDLIGRRRDHPPAP